MNRRGQVIVPVLMAMVVLATLVAVMITYVIREAKWTAKQTENTSAFHLAEAGQEKGYLEISQSTSVWTSLQSGSQLTDFKFDKTYDDIPGGEYTISISSGPNASEVTIISVGRDALRKELRGIETVYSKAALSSAMYAATINVTGNNEDIEWGSVASQGAINLQHNMQFQCYPQLWAVGAITDSGLNNNCGSCVAAYSGDIRCANSSWSNNSSSPCTDSASWWSNNCSPGVPSAPSIAISEYEVLAQADHCPTSLGYASGASPAGSCYWPAGTTPSFSGTDPSTHTVYSDSASGFTIAGNNTCMGNTGTYGGTIIVANSAGSFAITGNNGGCNYTATPPSTAWKQYKLIDTAASSEYYGDVAYQQTATTFQFGMSGNPSMSVGTTISPTYHGFIYVQSGSVSITKNGIAIHGVIYSPNGVSGITGQHDIIFYDDNVANNVKTTASAPTRYSWQDVVYSAWPGP